MVVEGAKFKKQKRRPILAVFQFYAKRKRLNRLYGLDCGDGCGDSGCVEFDCGSEGVAGGAGGVGDGWLVALLVSRLELLGDESEFVSSDDDEDDDELVRLESVWLDAGAPTAVVSVVVVSVAPISSVSFRAQPANAIRAAAIIANFFIVLISLFFHAQDIAAGEQHVRFGVMHAA